MKKKAKVGIALATIIIAAGGVLAILFALDVIPLSRNKDIVDVYKAPDGSVYTLDLNTFRSSFDDCYADITCKLSNAQSRIYGERLRQKGEIDIKPLYIKYSVCAAKSPQSLKVLRRSFYDKSHAYIFTDDDEYSVRLDPGSEGMAIYSVMRREYERRHPRYF